MTLFIVQADGEYRLVKRRGRFAVERELAASPAHLEAAVREMQEKMIAGLRLKGYAFVGPDFELRGPLEHVEFSEDVDADPGPTASPDPRDAEAWQRWDRAEQARKARTYGAQRELVDYVLVAGFTRKTHDWQVSLPTTTR